MMNSETYTNKEDERCEILSAFGKIACAGSKCLRSAQNEGNNWRRMTCRLCDDAQTLQQDEATCWSNGEHGEHWKDVIAAVLAITELQEFRESTKPRVLMALAIR